MLQLNYSLFALSYYVVTVNNIMCFTNGLGFFPALLPLSRLFSSISPFSAVYLFVKSIQWL